MIKYRDLEKEESYYVNENDRQISHLKNKVNDLKEVTLNISKSIEDGTLIIEDIVCIF